MQTMLNVDRVWMERLVGHANTYVGQGWLERVNGKLLNGKAMRATVVLTDDAAQNILDWMLENPENAYPYSVPSNRQIVGIEITKVGVPV